MMEIMADRASMPELPVLAFLLPRDVISQLATLCPSLPVIQIEMETAPPQGWPEN